MIALLKEVRDNPLLAVAPVVFIAGKVRPEAHTLNASRAIAPTLKVSLVQKAIPINTCLLPTRSFHRMVRVLESERHRHLPKAHKYDLGPAASIESRWHFGRFGASRFHNTQRIHSWTHRPQDTTKFLADHF